ncbi:MAG: cytochrome C peroxidase [Planctomycetes bacterium]|nr:cytochrome C peroxidase [Planctomycetota bacterium]
MVSRQLHLIAAVLFALAAPNARPANPRLQLDFTHAFGAAPLRIEDVSLRTVGGNTISITRLAYLVSNIRLIPADGSAPLALGTVGFIDAVAGRTRLDLGAVPAGDYSGIAFDIGLEPARNHADPSVYPADHPLNPILNGLHWSWQGGYVFLAIEGRYVLPADQLGGYSFHIATDPHLMKITLPGAISIRASSRLVVRFDVAGVFDSPSPHTIRHADGADSTHSGPTDQLAGRLANNITHAFSLGPVSDGSSPPAPSEIPLVPPPPGTHRYFLTIPAGFNEPRLPRDNPLTVEGVALGEKLFFDKQLSGNSTQSCADCHRPAAAFSDAGNAYSIGAEGKPGKRNTMPLFNLAWMNSMTWDGKRTLVRDQALAPIRDELEMNHALESAVARLEAGPEYPKLFEKAFGSPGVSAERLGLALEQFLLTLISSDSKFDRMQSGAAVFTAEEQRGLDLFVLEFDPARGQFGADCFHCHSNELLTNNQFLNNGLDSEFTDRGRQAATGRGSDAGKFKVPSLRNIELTGPYMHDGRFATLEEVVDHYADGIKPSGTLDPNISKHPDGGLALSCEDRKALVAFLRTLTDTKYVRPEPQ